MKRAIVACACALFSASFVHAASINFYFSAAPLTSAGNPVPDPIVAPEGNPNANAPLFGRTLDGPIVTNPVFAGGRLYVWSTGDASGDLENPNVWNGLGFVVEVDGPGTMTTGGMFNVRRASSPAYSRWETGSNFRGWTNSQPPPTLPHSRTYNLFAVRTVGISFPSAVDGFDDGDRNILLGYLDFQANGGTSQVFFSISPGGVSRHGSLPGQDTVFFGAGDPGIPNNALNTRSRDPDAIITPEPAAAAALLLLMSLRRTRR